MEITETLYVKKRAQWRSWLKKNHGTRREIWLVYYRKDSGKPRIPYNDAVEEALCFGWIDSILKKIDKDRFAQRFTPRKPGSQWSAMNRERVRRLLKQGKMTPAGAAALKNHGIPLKRIAKPERLILPPDIARALKSDRRTWKNFQRFPGSYKRIRIGWIAGARKRPKALRQRLRYFLKMTAQNKRFGMVQ